MGNDSESKFGGEKEKESRQNKFESYLFLVKRVLFTAEGCQETSYCLVIGSVQLQSRLWEKVPITK